MTDDAGTPPPDARRVPDLFAAALELPADERTVFLDTACRGDAALRADVGSLLAALPPAQRLFDGAPHLAAEPGADVPADPALGMALGPWRLEQRIAVGGMGAVYRGERIDAAFRKQVAIKIIRPWLDSADIVERFRRERQVLADLEHPHIARLLDGGATPDGRPYLVMEYVYGDAIDRYADRCGLTIDERLRLFLTVCEAVQFAHRNLVVHRDLKPSNILVDRDGQVKLLDFGIAKALAGDAGPEAAGGPEPTMPAALTPRYASPEQLLGRRITTATDIYSLGVLLYELLAGSPPYEVSMQLTPDTVRVICDITPARPSRAAARLDGDAAGRRGQSPQRLARALAGDLDTIVLKMLRKEPERRYASVDELSADIRRHLDGLPVLAAPDRLGYRAGKFLRRHRTLAMATATTVVALSVALGVSLGAWRQAQRQTNEARQLAYESSLAATESALRENATDEASSRLEAAPEALRGWEWRHLSSRLDRSLASVRAHAQGVTCVRYAPDGLSVLTASADGTIRRWDAATGAALGAWGPFGTSVEGFALAPDGSWLVVGMDDGRVLLLDGAAAAAPVVLHDDGRWSAVAASPDGRFVATGNLDGFVRVWETATWRRIASWRAHPGLSQVAWVPGGDRLVTGGGDGEVKVWAAATGRLIQAFHRHTRRVYCLAVSADGRRVASGGMDQIAVVHDVESGEHLATFRGHAGTVAGLVFTPDGAQVLSCGPDGRFLRWDVRTGVVLAELRGHRADVSAVAVSPDGARVASADWAGTLKIWEAGVADVAVHRVPSLATAVPHVYRVAVDPAGRFVSCGHSQTGLPVWPLTDTVTEPATVTRTPQAVIGLDYTPDGRRLLAGTGAGLLMVLDVVSGAVLDTIGAHDGALVSVAVHPSGRLVATGGEDARVRIRDLAADGGLGRQARELPGPAGAVLDLAFTPDGALLAGAAADSQVYVWDWPTGETPLVLRGHLAPVLDLCTDPGGAHLASTSADGTLRLWALPDGRPLAVLALGHNRGGAVAWSRDGSRLAVGGIDGAVRLLDAASLRELVGLRRHVARVTSLVFGPDDACLVSGSRDGTVSVWTAPADPRQGSRPSR